MVKTHVPITILSSHMRQTPGDSGAGVFPLHCKTFSTVALKAQLTAASENSKKKKRNQLHVSTITHNTGEVFLGGHNKVRDQNKGATVVSRLFIEIIFGCTEVETLSHSREADAGNQPSRRHDRKLRLVSATSVETSRHTLFVMVTWQLSVR